MTTSDTASALTTEEQRFDAALTYLSRSHAPVEYTAAVRHLQRCEEALAEHVRSHPFTVPDLVRRGIPRRLAVRLMHAEPLWRLPDHFAVRTPGETGVVGALPHKLADHLYTSVSRWRPLTQVREEFFVGLDPNLRALRDDAQYIAVGDSEGLQVIRPILARYTLGGSQESIEKLRVVDPDTAARVSTGGWGADLGKHTPSVSNTGIHPVDVIALGRESVLPKDGATFHMPWGYSNKSAAGAVRHFDLDVLFARNGMTVNGTVSTRQGALITRP